MQHTELEMTELRERMRTKGVTVMRLSVAAQLYPNEAYRIFAGGRIGPVRRARITEAARQLGLLDEPNTLP